MSKNQPSYIKYSLIVLLVLGSFLLIFRFVDLSADPPAYFAGHGQAQLTDPYHLTHAARNDALFGQANPYDDHRWDVFKFSLVSLTARIVFMFFGVSKIVANLSGLLLLLGGFFFLLWGLYRKISFVSLSIVAFVLLVNNLLFFYGRQPFLETGLIFISGLLFYLFLKFHDKLWGQVLIGSTVAIAGLAGKLFGLILLGPVVITFFYIYRKDSIKPIILVITGGVVTAVLFVLLFFGGEVSLLTRYYGEQTTGMYGGPPGFSGISNFVRMLITYGGESGFYKFTPGLLILSWLSVLLVLLTFSNDKEQRLKQLPVLFLLGWLGCGILGLSPFFYRPIRYGLFLFLPAAGIIGYAFGLLFDKDIRFKLKPLIPMLLGLLVLNWYAITQVIMMFSPKGSKHKFGIDMLPTAFGIAVVVTGIIYLLIRNRKRRLPVKSVGGLLLTLLILSGCYQGLYIKNGMSDRTHFIHDASVQLPDYITNDAVISGPFGATMAIDNELPNVIYMFGLTNIDKSLFDKFPISHIVTDKSNWEQALKDYPFLKESYKIVQMPVRKFSVDVYRLGRASTQPTDFELGSLHLTTGAFDSSYFYYNRFFNTYPNHTMGRSMLPFCLLRLNRLKEAEAAMIELTRISGENYFIYSFSVGFYREMYARTQNDQYQQEYLRLENKIKNLGKVDLFRF